jgi:hypothetical protein
MGLFKTSLDSDRLLLETGREVPRGEEDRVELRSRRLLEVPATKYDVEDETGKLVTVTPAISGILVTLTQGWYSNELRPPPESKLPVLDRGDTRFSWITEGSLLTTLTPSPSLYIASLSDLLSNLS